MYKPKGWENPYTECNKSCKKLYNGKPFSAVEEAAFEAGADAMLEAIWKLAKESPTGVFSFDTNAVNVPSVFIPEGDEE